MVLNPVRARMVASVEDWHWGSYLPTAGRIACPPWLAADVVLGMFGEGVVARRAYQRFVAQGLQQPSPWAQLQGQIYLGSEAFHHQIQKRRRAVSPRGISRQQLDPLRPEAPAILRSVAKVHGIGANAVLDRRQGAAFKQAVYLLRRRANLSLAQVAKMAGVSIGRIAQIQREIESAPIDERMECIIANI